jgi:hypothetical protein
MCTSTPLEMQDDVPETTLTQGPQSGRLRLLRNCCGNVSTEGVQSRSPGPRRPIDAGAATT